MFLDKLLLKKPMKTILPPIVIAVLLSVSHLSGTLRYVDASSANPTPPYTNWTGAASVLQDAVDSAGAGDEIIVTNGTYSAGGRAVGTNILVNRMAVEKPVLIRSVNGPAVTIIRGYQPPGLTNGQAAIRCAYLAAGATLAGFTLTDGGTASEPMWEEAPWPQTGGGGLWCESESAVASNCVLVANSASWRGGGAVQGTLVDCLLIGNSAGFNAGFMGGGGGAAEECTLNNCTLTGNKALSGGGAAGWVICILNNCIAYFNTAENAAVLILAEQKWKRLVYLGELWPRMALAAGF